MSRRRAQYRYTARRKQAWRKAQAKGAKMRKGSGRKRLAIAAGVGVLAVGVGAAVIYGHTTVKGGPKAVIKHKPPQAKLTAPNGPKGVRAKEVMPGDVVEFKRRHRVNAFESYETYDYGEVLQQDDRSVSVRLFGQAGGVDKGKILQGVQRRNITGHRIKRTGISPNPKHVTDAMWQRALLTSHRFLKENP